MPDNTVTTDIDREARIFHFRLIGALSGDALLKAEQAAYLQVDDPGQYDHIFDLRRFINIIQFDDLVSGIELWRKMRKQPDATTRWAMITDDALRISRCNAYAPLFPDLEVNVFSSLSDAMMWLRPHPVTADAKAV